MKATPNKKSMSQPKELLCAGVEPLYSSTNTKGTQPCPFNTQMSFSLNKIYFNHVGNVCVKS